MELYFFEKSDKEINWDLKHYKINKDGYLLDNGKILLSPLTAEKMTVELFNQYKKYWFNRKNDPKNWRHFYTEFYINGLKEGGLCIEIGYKEESDEASILDKGDVRNIGNLFTKRDFIIDSEYKQRVFKALFKGVKK